MIPSVWSMVGMALLVLLLLTLFGLALSALGGGRNASKR